MSAILLVVMALVVLSAAYIFHGRFLSRKLDIDPSRETPACTHCDGVDYVPAKPFVLLGHHFASIAGAGPILGPVFAATFGWGPVYLWIIFGVILIGGVHDFTTLVASIRHQGKSMGEVIEKYIGASGKKLFLIFTWLMLILVIAVFANACASTFVKNPSAATSSFLFIILAVLFGFCTQKLKLPFWPSTIIGVLLLLGCILMGLQFPIQLPATAWICILFGYVFIASVTPVWILLQPRDFLNSFLLYFLLVGGIIGIFVANPVIQTPVFTSFHTDLGPLFPILFVTVACGAISGFHSLVASGTTSKQLSSEADAKPVGYGAMMIEAVLAVVALITAVVLLPADYHATLSAAGGGPITIFANGVGGFLSFLGLPLESGITFAALAISAFAMTTLDTATRLGRFVFQELCDDQPSILRWGCNRYIGTLVTVVVAIVFTLSGTSKVLWPLFGSANQLLAAMALLGVSAWLAHLKKKIAFVIWPMLAMFSVTVIALGMLIYKNIFEKQWLLVIMGIMLLYVAVVMIMQTIRKMKKQ